MAHKRIDKKELTSLLLVMGFVYQRMNIRGYDSKCGYTKDGIEIDMSGFSGLMIRKSGLAPRSFLDINHQGYDRVQLLQYINYLQQEQTGDKNDSGRATRNS